MRNTTLKYEEKFMLSLNNKTYYRCDNRFTTDYNLALKSKSLSEIIRLQRQFGGEVLEIKERIWITEIEV